MVTILGQLREADHHPPTLDGYASRLESVRMEAAEQLGVVIHHQTSLTSRSRETGDGGHT